MDNKPEGESDQTDIKAEAKSDHVDAILDYRFKNHHAYVNRQWQYYASYILLNGLVITSVNDNQSVIFRLGLAVVSIFTSVVFFHLILWTTVRIHRNAKKINEITNLQVIQAFDLVHPKGMTLWLIGSIIFVSIAWLAWLDSINSLLATITLVLAVALIALSLWACLTVLYEIKNDNISKVLERLVRNLRRSSPSQS